MGNYRLGTCEICKGNRVYRGKNTEFEPTRVVLSFNIQHKSTTIYVYCLAMLFYFVIDSFGTSVKKKKKAS